MPTGKYAAYTHAAPYFDLVRGALGDLVDGTHFFDVVDNDLAHGQFRGYCEAIELHSADHLIAHKADSGRVLVIEYEIHGTILATGVKYNNRFCSIIHIENRKVTHWRDYINSLAAWNALKA